MARHEEHREDLMAEAVALVRRIEIRVPGESEAVTAGWRSTGWFSVYFGQDVAYTFDEAGRLRRAFADGFLYRTQGTTLARLERRRTEKESTLVRHDLTPDELAAFLVAMRGRLGRLTHVVAAREVDVLRTAGGEASGLLTELAASLEQIGGQTEVLAPPIAAGRSAASRPR
jgi:hypothetical protein